MFVSSLCLFLELHHSPYGTAVLKRHPGSILRRVECIPGETHEQVTLDQCSRRGCCWREDGTGGIFVPKCYHSFPAKYNYAVQRFLEPVANKTRVYDLRSRDNLGSTPLGTATTLRPQVSALNSLLFIQRFHFIPLLSVSMSISILTIGTRI
jgi:hypothetical protein